MMVLRMKFFDKIKVEENDKVVKKYKFLGIDLFSKESSGTLYKLEFLGISIYRKHLKRSDFSEAEFLKREIIYHSDYFDADWYRRIYFYVDKEGNDAAMDCLRNGLTGKRNPGPEFYANEYLIINPDVKEAKMHPLLHYERYGWREGRAVSLADIKKPTFPEGTEEIEKVFSWRQFKDSKVVSVFASYSGNGLIDDYVVYLLKGLKEISDYIILVADNPIYSLELEKIKDIVNSCLFKRHEEYDFGSYKYGFKWLNEHNILQEEDDLLFMNDSNYGPLYPLNNVLLKYRNANVDFYGLSLSTTPIEHIQSFFYIFNRKVYSSKEFSIFLENVRHELSAANVVYNYEMRFTRFLSDGGFKYATYVTRDSLLKSVKNGKVIPTKYSKTLIEEFDYPLIKIKAILGSTEESPEEIENYLKKRFPDFYRQILFHLQDRKEHIRRKIPKKLNKYTLYNQYNQTVDMIRRRVVSGKKIRCIFLVNLFSMFAAENLMNEMLIDKEFYEVELYAIPEIRFSDEEMLHELDKTYQALKEKYPFAKKAVDVKDGKIVHYNDVIDCADIVCYPSPYNVSYSLYNPYHAARQGILSIHINYGFFRSKYDRIVYQIDNYNNFWKVFLETEYNLEEYRRFGQCNAANAVLTGYAKMDGLASFQKQMNSSSRKKIILAPHHSVKDGENAILALSNFERYADFFLSLPERYPEIDFIFRPHPVLFPVLSRENKWGKKKVDAYLNKMKSHSNVAYSDGGDYMQVFAESDAIIQDSGSFLVEYLYTGKPCCYLLKDKRDIEEKFVELGKKCLEHCYIAYAEEEIIHFIEEVVMKGRDEKQSMRDTFRRQTLMLNYPNVSRNIRTYIKNYFLR